MIHTFENFLNESNNTENVAISFQRNININYTNAGEAKENVLEMEVNAVVIVSDKYNYESEEIMRFPIQMKFTINAEPYEYKSEVSMQIKDAKNIDITKFNVSKKDLSKLSDITNKTAYEDFVMSIYRYLYSTIQDHYKFFMFGKTGDDFIENIKKLFKI